MNVARFIFSVVLLAGWLFAPGTAEGQLTRLGEFKVDQGPGSGSANFSRSMITGDAQGNFVVVWHHIETDGKADIYFRRYNSAGSPLGDSVRVNTTTAGEQSNPAVAMRADGAFVVVWNSLGQDGSNQGVYLRRYDGNGQPLTGEVLVNTFTSNEQQYPHISMNALGAFVVVWESFGQDGAGWGVYAQRYTNAGVQTGAEIPINGGTVGNQRYPYVAMDAEANFAVVWTSDVPGGGGQASDVYLRRFTNGGTQAQPESRVNDYVTGDQSASGIGMAPDGRFVVAWESGGEDGSGQAVTAQRYDSGGSRRGGNFVVNQATSGNQNYCGVAVKPDGEFLITYRSANFDGSGFGVGAHRFNDAGTELELEFVANTTAAGDQLVHSGNSAVYDPQGNFIIVWTDQGTSVRADKFYLPNQGPPTSEFRVNTTTAGDQTRPSVAMNATGSAVVVWQSVGQDGSGTGIYGQRFAANGQRVGPEFRVNFDITGDQTNPVVAMRDSGGFVVAWSSSDGSDTGIYGQFYEADGRRVSELDFRANTSSSGEQSSPTVAMNGSGNCVIAWQTEGGSFGIHAQRYSPQGAAQGTQFVVNTETAGDQTRPTAFVHSDGSFLVAWQTRPDDEYGTLAQRFNANGVPVGGEFKLHSTSNIDQVAPCVAVTNDGSFVGVWESRGQDGSGDGVYAQRFTSAAVKSGMEFRVNTFVIGDQGLPSVSMDAGGRFVVTWRSSNQDQSGNGIFGQRFQANGIPIGEEFRANQFITGDQETGKPGRIHAGDQIGNFLIAWQSAAQDGSGYGIYATKVFVPVLPKVVSAAATNPTGDGVTLTGVVNPGSAATQVRFEYGPTSNLGSMTAWQMIGDGHVDAPVSVPVTGLGTGNSYFYQLVAMNGQGPAVRGALLAFTTAPVVTGPSAAPSGSASLQANLTPATARWRIQGEANWRRNSNDSAFVAAVDNASGLAVASEYAIEFEPQGGSVPPPQTVRIANTGLNQATVSYPTAIGEQGTIQVLILPQAVANSGVAQQKGQWRFLGDGATDNPNDASYATDPSWRDSGAAVSNKSVGAYVIQFKQVPLRTKVPNRGIAVKAGQTVTLTAFYEDPATVAGTLPQVLSVAEATTMEPYFLAGQVQTDLGDGSGYVVQERVVLTAGHVVFDDQALSVVTSPIPDGQLSNYTSPGVRWRFQRMQGQFEPVPIEPRGSYILSGYAEARRGGVPGQGTQQSQENDVAALYFNVPAGRGGSSGYLVTGANTDWVLRNSLKTLVSYPVNPDYISATNAGRMHATTPTSLAFTKPYGAASKIYRTTAIAGVAGSSGGALCVQYDDGHYFPAAVYVGGNSEAIFRAIDADVDDLIQRADVSSRGGSNNTSGGIVLVESKRSVAAFTIGKVIVNLGPASAVAAGAQWRLTSNGTNRALQNSQASDSPPAGSYTLTFAPLPRFAAPPPVNVEIDNSTEIVFTGTYLPAPVFTTDTLLSPLVGEAYSAVVTATGNAQFSAQGLPRNLAIDAQGRITGTPAPGTAGPHAVKFTATNAAGSTDQTIILVVREAQVLFLDFEPTRGAVSSAPRKLKQGVNKVGKGEKLTLTAKAKSPGSIFSDWAVLGATPATSRDTKFVLEIPNDTSAPAVNVSAHFIANPFTALAGHFAGRVQGATPGFANTGTLTLKLISGGAFTGTVRLGAKTYRLRDKFPAPDGAAAVSTVHVGIAGTTIVLDLTLDLSGGTERITGQVNGTGETLDVTLDRAVFDAKHPATDYVGSYTLLFPRDATRMVDAAPQGHGFGTVTVKPDGTVRFVGTLGDGTKLSQSGLVSKTGTWPFHALLYQKGGVLSGDLVFHDTPGVSDLGGTLDWIKPATSNARTTYPQGFTVQTHTLGSRYDKTLAVPKSRVTFGAGLLSTALTPVIVTNNAGHFTADPLVPGFSLKLTAATGLFQGTLPASAGLKPGKFQGAIFQKIEGGEGYFLGEPLPGGGLSTGFVELQKKP